MTKDIKRKKKDEYFGMIFTSLLNDWKKEKPGNSQEKFAELVGVQTSNSITDWKKGTRPSPKFMQKICEEFKVDENIFYPKAPDDQYRYSCPAITTIGKRNVEFAEKNGLNLELVSALSGLIDFNKTFPKYSPIVPVKSNFLDGPTFARQENSDSAVIDQNLKFLQIDRNGKTYTMHKVDLLYLKEVQDQIIDFVEYLFFKRSKEMEKEVEKFNEDSVINRSDGGKQFVKITKEYIQEHDRFAKYFDFNDIDSKEGK